jgi:hypothetical protein
MIFDTLLSHSRLFFAAAAVAVLLVSAAPQSTAQQQPLEADVFPPYKLAALDPPPENTMDSSNIGAVRQIGSQHLCPICGPSGKRG